MRKNTKNFKAINKRLINVTPPEDKPLPFNGVKVQENGFTFSFSCFDRTHKFFNLGGVTVSWFIDLLDCLKSVSGKTIADLKNSIHDFHPVNWSRTNVKCPSEQGEYWQFRINKSKGRVIGLLIENVFYVVWLDPHHNITNSEGYGGIKKFQTPK